MLTQFVPSVHYAHALWCIYNTWVLNLHGEITDVNVVQAESTAMDTNEPRRDVGSSVFNLPADAWVSDSDAGSDEQLHSDDDIMM